MSQTQPLQDDLKGPTTLLVGNPNVGKSVLFGVLTGRYATVSNYPGTTVEVTRGTRRGGGDVIDTPGTNSLLPNSEDEQVTRDILLDHLDNPALRLVQVCDAKNLRRGLALSVQLAELELPMVLCTNMLDEARSRGIRIDHAALAKKLGIEVIGAVATRREGTAPLVQDTLVARPCSVQLSYPQPIEEGIEQITAALPQGMSGKRGVAIMLLAGDRSLRPWAASILDPQTLERIDAIVAQLARTFPEPVRFAINRARLEAVDDLLADITHRQSTKRNDLLRRFGDLSMHPVWGLPVAALILYLIYLLVGELGAGTAVDFFENTIFAKLITPGADALLRFVLPSFLEVALVGPVGTEPGTGPGLLVGEYGLISMALSYAIAIVLPIVGFFFIAFSVMEDSGYLPRLAIVLNRLFRLIGLNGKAVLPMVLGLGCDTMATMTTRVLATKKERVLVTLLLALGVPCSAQLGVILGMLAGLSLWATATWLVTVLVVMLAVGFLAARLLPGQSGDFILEVPPMRRPQLGNILIKTAARIEWYLKEAVPLFILGTFVLWVLDRLAVMSTLQTLAAPVVEVFLGLPAKATDAFLIGFLRRDYGAAGLFALFNDQLKATEVPVQTEIQVVVAMTTITLFVPCIANIFMIIKERGLKTALWITAFVFPFAFGVGGALNFILRGLLL